MSGPEPVSTARQVPPPPPGPFVARLHNLTGVRRELAKLYTEARRGKLDPADASKLANILQILARVIEGSDLEARLSELERRQSQPDGHAGNNGGRTTP